MKNKHHRECELTWDYDGVVATSIVDLATGDSAWDPSCTSCKIWGPARVIYRHHPDGGIDATVIPIAAGVVCKCDEDAKVCPMHGRRE